MLGFSILQCSSAWNQLNINRLPWDYQLEPEKACSLNKGKLFQNIQFFLGQNGNTKAIQKLSAVGFPKFHIVSVLWLFWCPPVGHGYESNHPIGCDFSAEENMGGFLILQWDLFWWVLFSEIAEIVGPRLFESVCWLFSFAEVVFVEFPLQTYELFQIDMMMMWWLW